MIIIYQCMIIMLIYCLYTYAYYVDIYLLFMDDAWKKGKTLCCAKIGIFMPLLIFKIQCTNLGGVFYFDGLSMFYL
jgi:hypothetical protein